MDQPFPVALRSLIAPGRAAVLVLLMLAAALTEGLGLMLAVPLLGVLGAEGGSSRVAALFDALHLPLALGPLLALFVALITLRAVLNHTRTMAAQRFEIALVDGLRRRAWQALLDCDWRVLMTLRRGESAALLISDTERVGWGAQQGLAALTVVITLTGIGLAALTISPLLTSGAAVSAALVLLAYAGMRRRARYLGEELGSAYAAVHTSLGEGLGALRVIKSLAAEAGAAAAVANSFSGMRQAQIAFRRDHGLGQVALQIGGAAALAVLVWLAVERWHLGAATILPMVALFARALPLLGALQEAWVNWSHARPALTATLDLIARAEAAGEPTIGPVAAPQLTRELTFEAVTVRFGDAPAVLSAVSLSIPARGMVALIGPSGAGKSTLADLAGGLLAPDSGTVKIDGEPLDGERRRAWRGRVSYVQQEPVLLAATLRDNLRWAAPQASDDDLRAALADAAADFADTLSEGLDTRLGDGGRTLSGGERQRLMLARALLRKPALLILDEATSALDAANEAQVARAVGRLKQRMAVLVIGHRGALLELADRTVSLNQGRIVEETAGGRTNAGV